MSPAIDPTFAVGGPEWSIGGLESAPSTGSGKGFAGMLGQQISQLAATQSEASSQAQQLAVGDAEDPTAVVMAVEKAQLQMQLATTLRNKGVESIQELMRTQV